MVLQDLERNYIICRNDYHERHYLDKQSLITLTVDRTGQGEGSQLCIQNKRKPR